MRSPERRHLRLGALVVPERRGVTRQLARRIDQDGTVHLAACTDGFNAIRGIWYGRQNLPDDHERTAPPNPQDAARPSRSAARSADAPSRPA